MKNIYRSTLPKLSKLPALLGLSGLLLHLAASPLHAANDTWGALSGSNNWTASNVWGIGVAAPTTGDTANLNSLVAGYTVTYDTGASGQLGTLNMSGTTLTPTTLLLNKSLALSAGGTVYSTVLGGIDSIQLAGSSTLTVNNGATFNIGINSAANITGNYVTTAGGYTGTGMIVNGTLNFQSANIAPVALGITAPLTMGANSTLKVDTEGTGGTLAVIGGNFTTSASANTVTATSTGSYAGKGGLYLQGANVNIGAGTVFTGFADGTTALGNTAGIYFNQTTAGTQTVAMGAATGFGILNSASSGTATTVLSSTATVGGVANAVDSISISSLNSGANSVLKLGGNLNFAGGSYTTPFFYTLANNMTATLDLNGYVYNAAAGTASTTFSPTGTTAATSSYIAITNSGASSIAGNQGILKAAAIDLGNADVSVGSGVILQATAAGSVNDLGQKDAGATTNVNAGSTFYYNTAGAATLKSTNGRTVGAVQVGDGTTAAILRLGTAITAAGNVTASANATLDTNGNNLVLSGAANLAGTGVITNTNASTGSIVSFASGATGGLNVAGTGTAGNLTFTAGTKPLTLQLANSTSTFDLLNTSLGAGTYDTVTLNGANLDLTNSNLVLNMAAGTYNGTIQLFNLQNGATITGLPLSITSNLGAAETFSLNSSGLLTITAVAVPEPSTVILSVLGGLFLCGAVLRNRRLAQIAA